MVVVIVDSIEEFDKHLKEFLLAIGEALNCIAKLVGRRLVVNAGATTSKRQAGSPE